jgi:hypothetical protein
MQKEQEKIIKEKLQNFPFEDEAKYHIALNGDSWRKDIRGADSNQLTNSISHDIDPKERKATYFKQRRKDSEMDFESLREKMRCRGDMEESYK